MDGGLDDELEGEAPDAATLAGQAWRRAAAAVARGVLRDAQGWTRLWRELSAAARAEASALGGEAALEPRPAHAETSLTRSRKAAKGIDGPGAARDPAPTPALRVSEPAPLQADPSLSGFAASRELSCSSEPADPAPGVEAHSVHPVSAGAPGERSRSPPLNRAERRRRERLAAAQAWKARALGGGGGSANAPGPA